MSFGLRVDGRAGSGICCSSFAHGMSYFYVTVHGSTCIAGELTLVSAAVSHLRFDQDCCSIRDECLPTAHLVGHVM